MTTTLTGEVGRTGRMEDVAMVQALLANTEGPDGRPFWDRRIDGRPGAELAAAIEAFQRRWAAVAVAGDDPKDQAAIRLGFSLWNRHRFPVPRGFFISALRLSKSELNTR